MAKIKLLLIEDDLNLVEILKNAVDSQKFELLLATTADEGLDQAIINQPAAIILDILLPGKNGFECLRDLKLGNKTKNIPVLILSNIGQEEEVKKGIAMGAKDYLIKADFTIDQVIAKINKIANSSK